MRASILRMYGQHRFPYNQVKLGVEFVLDPKEGKMLVLSRKVQQKVTIGSGIVITLIAIKGNRVRIGIEAPHDIQVLRSELTDLCLESSHSYDSQFEYSDLG